MSPNKKTVAKKKTKKKTKEKCVEIKKQRNYLAIPYNVNFVTHCEDLFFSIYFVVVVIFCGVCIFDIYLIVVYFYILIFINNLGALRRCYQCRSRGELGSCKDPFKFNVTQIENEHGITAVPCASGWCGKVIESQGTLREDGTYDSIYFIFI